MKLRWSQFGGQAGIVLVVVGVILIFLGWNGAASYDRVPSQFPYLISGGFGGLAVVVVGAALMVVQTLREDRAALIDAVHELRDAVDRAGASTANADGGLSPAVARAAENAGLVVAGPSSYHRPSCHLIEGRGQLPTITPAEASSRHLSPCRVCGPDLAEMEPAVGSRRRSRRRS